MSLAYACARSYRCPTDRVDDVVRYLQAHQLVAPETIRVVGEVVHYELDDASFSFGEADCVAEVVRRGCEAVLTIREWT
jgi:hypothetical protein